MRARILKKIQWCPKTSGDFQGCSKDFGRQSQTFPLKITELGNCNIAFFKNKHFCFPWVLSLHVVYIFRKCVTQGYNLQFFYCLIFQLVTRFWFIDAIWHRISTHRHETHACESILLWTQDHSFYSPGLDFSLFLFLLLCALCPGTIESEEQWHCASQFSHGIWGTLRKDIS